MIYQNLCFPIAIILCMSLFFPLTTSKLSVYHFPPKLIIFDLDTLVWPLWVRVPKLELPLEKLRDGQLIDRAGVRIKAYDQVPDILKFLKKCGYTLAVVGRIGDEVLDAYSWNQYFKYKEIFPGSKLMHIAKLAREARVRFENILFLSHSQPDTEEVQKCVKVKCVYVPDDISREFVRYGLSQFDYGEKKRKKFEYPGYNKGIQFPTAGNETIYVMLKEASKGDVEEMIYFGQNIDESIALAGRLNITSLVVDREFTQSVLVHGLYSYLKNIKMFAGRFPNESNKNIAIRIMEQQLQRTTGCDYNKFLYFGFNITETKTVRKKYRITAKIVNQGMKFSRFLSGYAKFMINQLLRAFEKQLGLPIKIDIKNLKRLW